MFIKGNNIFKNLLNYSKKLLKSNDVYFNKKC